MKRICDVQGRNVDVSKPRNVPMRILLHVVQTWKFSVNAEKDLVVCRKHGLIIQDGLVVQHLARTEDTP